MYTVYTDNWTQELILIDNDNNNTSTNTNNNLIDCVCSAECGPFQF